MTDPERIQEQRVRAIAEALRQPAMAVDGEWLESARAALLTGNETELQALSFGYASAVTRAEITNGVGLISVRGPLIEGFFFTDYSDIAEAVSSYTEDSGVSAIVLDIDSPGGVVTGALWSACEVIRESRESKPIWAVANDQATSAAYLLAAQAGRVIASGRSAILGSLGVIATHTDRSVALEQSGYRITERVTGRLKNLLSPNRPLSKEGARFLDDLIGAAFSELIEHVVAGRPVLTDESIRALEGAMVIGAEAVDQGLADEVMSLDDAMAQVVERAGNGSPLGASAPASSAATEGENMTDPTTPAGQDPSAAANQQQPAQPAASPQPAAAAPATPAPSPAAPPVDESAARAQGAEAERQRTAGIRQACALAGVTGEELDGYLRDTGATAESVSANILERRAQASEDEPEVNGNHSGAQPYAGPTLADNMRKQLAARGLDPRKEA